jgi:hypothetical protein
MGEQDLAESRDARTDDGATAEMSRLLGLLQRLEHENASLRRELASSRPLAA